MPNNIKMKIIIRDNRIPYCPFHLEGFVLGSVGIYDVFGEAVDFLDSEGWNYDQRTLAEGWYYEGGVGFGVLCEL